MPREKSGRKFQLTINNPKEHDMEHAAIRARIEEMSGCLYWCMCDEVGEQGTYHTHVYMAFKNAKEFSAIQCRFYGAHIELARGSHRENRDYIRKEGKYRDTEKAETNLPDTFEEFGEMPPESDRRVKQSEAIMDMLDSGASNAEILRAFPSAMTRLNAIISTRQAFREEKYRTVFRQLEVSYIWGKTGVGKTRSIMEKYGYANVFRVTNYAHPFDSYEGEDVILFDEFRSSLPISDMLKYLDGYPVKLPARYCDRVACYTKVYVVSNIPMIDQYRNIQLDEPETWNAFLRRFQDVHELAQGGPDGLPF